MTNQTNTFALATFLVQEIDNYRTIANFNFANGNNKRGMEFYRTSIQLHKDLSSLKTRLKPKVNINYPI